MDNKTMIHLEVRDEYGYIYDLKQEGECENFKDDFARLINQFMDIMTWPGYKNDYIFLESITDEEYDLLSRTLEEHRNQAK